MVLTAGLILFWTTILCILYFCFDIELMNCRDLAHFQFPYQTMTVGLIPKEKILNFENFKAQIHKNLFPPDGS